MPTDIIQKLPLLPLFSRSRASEGFLPFHQSVRLSIERAQTIVRAYALTVQDVAKLSDIFWDLHRDPIMWMDGGAATFTTIQVNLAAGTLAMYINKQPSLKPWIDNILRFDILAHYCLTEVDHGLDAINLETVAVALPEGGFELHTPHAGAAKLMPPTSPSGLAAVAVVFAKLVVGGVNHGTRSFLVPLNDGKKSFKGVRCKLLPPRGGSAPVNHSITYFDHVRLPQSALLGQDMSAPTSKAIARINHHAATWRVAVGALALGSMSISSLERASYINARFSQWRTVTDGEGNPFSIMGFRTQYTPILVALAQAAVCEAFYKAIIKSFLASDDSRVQHAYAAVFKATAIHHAQAANLELSERCGARGLFIYNDIVAQHAVLRGIAIAEGDILGLCIRTASELLLERYSLEEASRPLSPLAQHEKGLIDKGKALVREMGHHRSEAFSRLILRDCENIVRAIGHRMAYEAAIDAGLDSRITDLYLVSAVKLDSAWYVDAGWSRELQQTKEAAAIDAALPGLDRWLRSTGVENYAQVPINSRKNWDAFVDGLQTFGDAQSEVFVHSKL